MGEDLRKKLAQVEDELRSLREERAAKVREREAAKEAYAAIPDGQDDSEAFKRAKEAVAAVGEIDDRIAAASEKQVAILKMLGDHEAAQRQEAASGASRGARRGWGVADLLADTDLQERLKFAASTKSRVGNIEIGEVISRDELAGMFAENGNGNGGSDGDIGEVTTRMRQGTWRGVLVQPTRQLSLLDLIPTGTADGNLIPYTQEVGTLTGGGPAAEGEVKPQADIAFVDEDAPVRTIAAWVKLRKQILSDFPALRTIVDTRLRYLVQRRLEEQIVSGDGTGQNLTGLLNTSGVGQVEFNAAVPLNELVLSGITNVYLNEGVADGIALHPVDWMKVITEKAANQAGDAGSFDYYGGGPWGATPLTLWGVPVVPSQALTEGTGIVADFALGVSLLIREGVNVLLSDSDQDDFIRNRITMLGEMRAALPVWRPSVIQVVQFASSD